MSPRSKIDPGYKWDDNLPMSPGILIGDTVYTSGQVALDPDGNVVGAGDMKAQTWQVMENLEKVLEAAGSSLGDVVKVTVYVTDMSRRSSQVSSSTWPALRRRPPPVTYLWSTGVTTKFSS